MIFCSPNQVEISMPTEPGQRGSGTARNASQDADVFARPPSDPHSGAGEQGNNEKGWTSKMDSQGFSSEMQSAAAGGSMDDAPGTMKSQEDLWKRRAGRRSSLVPIEVSPPSSVCPAGPSDCARDIMLESAAVHSWIRARSPDPKS